MEVPFDFETYRMMSASLSFCGKVLYLLAGSCWSSKAKELAPLLGRRGGPLTDSCFGDNGVQHSVGGSMFLTHLAQSKKNCMNISGFQD